MRTYYAAALLARDPLDLLLEPRQPIRELRHAADLSLTPQLLAVRALLLEAGRVEGNTTPFKEALAQRRPLRLKQVIDYPPAAHRETGAPETTQRHEDAQLMSGKEIVNWALDNDPVALRVVATCGEYLGRGMAILIDTLNPELIVVGGMAVRLGELLLEPARRVVNQEAIAGGAGACSIVSAALGKRIGDVEERFQAVRVYYRSGDGEVIPTGTEPSLFP